MTSRRHFVNPFSKLRIAGVMLNEVKHPRGVGGLLCPESHGQLRCGWVQFSFGACELQAKADALRLTVSADSEAAFARVKHVVADHLIRFGSAETLRVRWVDAEV